jgi:hypothetical protein
MVFDPPWLNVAESLAQGGAEVQMASRMKSNVTNSKDSAVFFLCYRGICAVQRGGLAAR